MNSTSTEDNSRKSLNLLINRIFPSGDSKTIGKPFKAKDQSPHSNLSRRKQRKKPKPEVKSHKITEWLGKASLKKQSEESLNELKIKKSNNVDKSKPEKPKTDENQKRSKKDKMSRSDSFEQYGIVMPTIEEILEQNRIHEKHKKAIEAFDALEDVDLNVPSFLIDSKEKEEEKIPILDCKHLTLCDIREVFYNNLQFCRDIFEGRLYSERHQRFHNYKVEYTNTTKDLTYNTSMIVFDDDQKLELMELLEKELDPKDIHTRYFFQVLLPELCLKVFMDLHSMTKDEAIVYLDKRPIM